MQGVLARDEYFDYKNRYETQVAALNAEAEQLENELCRLDEEATQYRTLQQDQRRFKADKHLTAELIDRLVDRIEISRDKRITVHYRFDQAPATDAEVLEFVDNGYTGTNFERPQVQNLLEMVRANKIDCIIVKDFSRFGRNSIETGYFMERVFPLFHTRFISVSDDYDSDHHKGDTGGMDVAFKYLMLFDAHQCTLIFERCVKPAEYWSPTDFSDGHP